MRRSVVLVLVAVLTSSALGCTDDAGAPDGSSSAQLRVASFDFAESEVLAEVYAQAAERAGVPVTRLGVVGPREILAPAMRDGLVDLVPEYLGSALRFVGVTEPPDDVADATALLDERVDRFDIDVLETSSAVDSNVFVVGADVAERLDLESVSDLADSSLMRFGGPAECPERPYCLAGLRDTYGLSFEVFVAQPSLAFTAEALRRGEIDVGVMFSTSPELDASDLVALVDDRRLQPPENVTPLVRRPALERWGSALEPALSSVSQGLTTEELRYLNRRVADGASVDSVAREWLASLG